MKAIRIIIAIIVIVAIIGGYFLFTSQPASEGESTGMPVQGENTPEMIVEDEAGTPTTPKTYNVAIQNFAFNPSTLTIKKGDSVTWTNMDSVQHTATSDSGNEISSEYLSKGESYTHTFNTAGTYNYHCIPHPSMKAKIIVE